MKVIGHHIREIRCNALLLHLDLFSTNWPMRCSAGTAAKVHGCKLPQDATKNKQHKQNMKDEEGDRRCMQSTFGDLTM